MALRGYELVLFVRAQNQASATLRRVAGDVRALTRATDLQARSEALAIRQGRRQLVLEGRQAHLSNLRQVQIGQNLQKQLVQVSRFRTQYEAAMRASPRFMSQKVWKQSVATQQALQSAFIAHQEELDRLPPKYRRLMFNQRDLAKEVDRTTRSIDLQQRQMNLGVDEQRLIKQAQRVQIAQRMQQAGRTISHVGRAAQFGGLIGTAALGATAASAAKLNTTVTQAATQARDLDAPLAQIAVRADQIDDAVKNMMGRFPASAEEMSASAYDIFSSINLMNNGVTDMTKGFELMALANEVAVAGSEDLNIATQALITVLNNFDPALENPREQLDMMFNIIRFGRMRLAEFNEMMNKIAPAARGAGMELEDVAGAMAYLTEVMPSQRQVATGIARLLELFQHPDFVAGAKQLGMSITMMEGGVEKLRALPEILGEMVRQFPELRSGSLEAENFFRTVTKAGRKARTGKSGQGIFSTIFARRAFRLLTTGYDDFLSRQEQATTNINEFGNAFKAQINTAGVRWQVFTNRLRQAVLEIGEDVIPVFEEIGDHIGNLMDHWNGLDKATRRNIARWAGIVSVGALVGGMFLSIVGGIIALIGTLGLLGGALGAGKLAGLGRLAKLLAIVSRSLGPLGVIVISLKVLWTGEASAKDFLLGAIAGGLLGFAVGGLPGAVIGAITVPILLKVIASERGGIDTTLADMTEGYKNYVRRLEETAQQPINEAFNMRVQGRLDIAPLSEQDWLSSVRRQLEVMGFPTGIVKIKTKMDYSRLATQALEAGRITQQAYIKGMEIFGFGDQAIAAQQRRFAQQRMLQTQRDLSEHFDMIKKGTKSTAKAAKELSPYEQMLKDINNALDETADTTSDVARKQRELADAAKQAQGEIEQAAANLTQTYQNLKQANQQAFGDLFSGPWLESEFGQTAEEWGIEPRIQDLTKDLQMQLNEFNRFNDALAAVARRGAPAELVGELRALGPDALEKIEVLRRAAPGQFNAFLAVWRDKQAAIEEATKIDFDKQLQQWFQYGKGIAQQIIFGLRSENVALDNAFRQYITNRFPNYIDEAVAKARREQAERDKEGKPQQKPPGGTAPTGTKVEVNETTNITVNGKEGEDSVDTARRAAHLWRNGARRTARQWGIPKGTGRD